MGVPYENKPEGDLHAPAGVTSCFPLSFPNKTTITKIVIVQTDGGAADFAAALYNNESACGGRPESESLSGGVVAIFPPDLYRVTPDLAGVAGRLVYFSESVENGGCGFGFFNQDEPSRSNSIVGGPRTIYLAVTPAGDMTFAVVLGGDIYL